MFELNCHLALTYTLPEPLLALLWGANCPPLTSGSVIVGVGLPFVS